MNPKLSSLHRYPFEKLADLKAGCHPPANLEHIPLSIGEPKHAPPKFVIDTLTENLASLSNYPLTRGMDSLRETIANWLIKRFKLSADSIHPDRHILPVNGTREALFAIAQTLVDSSQNPLVMMPNPFYQIYEGAALLAGAEPFYLNTTADNDFLPDFDAVSESEWQRCQLLYICTPGNPTGRVIPLETLQHLIELSHKHNFILISDECYSELYFDEQHPPVGLLEAAQQMGITDYKNCLVFHSLSKRSNLPGLRSGFVAGDADVMKEFHKYRTYHGCAMPVPAQHASIAAWSDEQHVQHNRSLYQQKFTDVIEILNGALPVSLPDAGFYLWPETPIDDETFSRALFDQQNVTVLPGKYLSREANGVNPGKARIRMALVAEVEQCRIAAQRIVDFMQQYT